jgi:hypothetical protein
MHLAKRIIYANLRRFKKWIFLTFLVKQKEYTIRPIRSNDEVLLILKHKSLETTKQFIRNHFENSVTFFSAETRLIKLKNARVSSFSDLVLFDNDAIWEKFFNIDYDSLIPLDRNLIKVNKQSSKLSAYSYNKNIQLDIGVSLLGVFADIWSHFLFTQLPKLAYILENYEFLKNNFKQLTLLIPPYKDKNILEIIEIFKRKAPMFKILQALERTDYTFKEFLYFDKLVYMNEHSSIVSPMTYQIPKSIIFLNNKHFFNDILPIIPAGFNVKLFTHKIFLERNNKVRNLNNYEEVKSYFCKKGFLTIDPQNLSLAEKKFIFSNSDIVCGPGSSAFSNVLFCKQKTKIIAFINSGRVFDNLMTNFIHIEFIYCKSNDFNPHSRYTLDLNEIEHLI